MSTTDLSVLKHYHEMYPKVSISLHRPCSSDQGSTTCTQLSLLSLFSSFSEMLTSLSCWLQEVHLSLAMVLLYVGVAAGCFIYWGKFLSCLMLADASIPCCHKAPVACTVADFSCFNHSDAEHVCAGTSFLMTGQTVAQSTDRKKRARQLSAVARKQGNVTHAPMRESAIQMAICAAKLLSSQIQQVHLAEQNSNETAEQQPACGHAQHRVHHAKHQTKICSSVKRQC